MKQNTEKTSTALLNQLNPRQRDVLTSRYGLKTGKVSTLAEIGGKYGVTRERIRQIEASGLKALRGLINSNNDFTGLVKNIISYLKKYNGVRQEDLLYADYKNNLEDGKIKFIENRMRFLLENSGVVNFHPADNRYHPLWYLTNDDFNRAESFINKLINDLNENKEKKFNTIDAMVNNYIQLSKKFAFNFYNDFGLAEQPEINPKTSRDWSYLVLKKIGAPIHFVALASAINKVRKNKKANPQTIHNELIKDNRFILVGRGTYGLREFNIVPGTAKEVISHILKKHGPKTSKEIIKLVNNERTFKENTLILNLQNKKHFQRLNDGRYSLI